VNDQPGVVHHDWPVQFGEGHCCLTFRYLDDVQLLELWQVEIHWLDLYVGQLMAPTVPARALWILARRG
jgi:hypothetical protein